MSYLKDEMPALFGAKKKQTKLIDNLEDVFQKASARQNPTVYQNPSKSMHFVHFIRCDGMTC
jgi:hypothetical protein